ncbi:MAG: VOC family protein [Gemmataceae bacterium]
MAKPVKPIPEGYHTVTPYLYVRGGALAIEFYKKAFNAQELFRMPGADERSIGHAEIKIGDSVIMLADEAPAMGVRSPQTLNGNSASFLIYVENVDAAFKQAIDAGATIDRPLENKFYGDRMGSLKDPFGHQWTLGTHIEDVSHEEMSKRLAAEQARMAGKKQS